MNSPARSQVTTLCLPPPPPFFRLVFVCSPRRHRRLACTRANTEFLACARKGGSDPYCSCSRPQSALSFNPVVTLGSPSESRRKRQRLRWECLTPQLVTARAYGSIASGSETNHTPRREQGEAIKARARKSDSVWGGLGRLHQESTAIAV